MSNVHIIFEEDNHGDLIDIYYFHHGCASSEAKEWPAPESVDYPVYCAECSERIHSVPLTDEGERLYGNR